MIERGISAVQKEPERVEIKRFPDKEKRVLKEVGAVVYSITGQTITGQRELREKEYREGKNPRPDFYYVVDAGDRLTALPSMLSEVAIYPDPKRFFVPDTGGKTLAEQEELVKKDADKLREILGLEEIDEVIPEEAATLTELTFKHLGETGIWLFGVDYNYWYGSTKNPIDESGDVAVVGKAAVATWKMWDSGLNVERWNRGRDGVVDEKRPGQLTGMTTSGGVQAVRLIVPFEKPH